MSPRGEWKKCSPQHFPRYVEYSMPAWNVEISEMFPWQFRLSYPIEEMLAIGLRNGIRREEPFTLKEKLELARAQNVPGFMVLILIRIIIN